MFVFSPFEKKISFNSYVSPCFSFHTKSHCFYVSFSARRRLSGSGWRLGEVCFRLRFWRFWCFSGFKSCWTRVLVNHYCTSVYVYWPLLTNKAVNTATSIAICRLTNRPMEWQCSLKSRVYATKKVKIKTFMVRVSRRFVLRRGCF